LTKSDDAALFERWRTKRDGEAFAELARRHAPVVFDVAARTLGDRTAAEDVVQEALLDLALETTDKPAVVGVPAWLVRFAICRARNQRSSERSRARRQQVVGKRRPEEAMPDADYESREELEHALAVAEPEERAVLAMRFLHGWEYDKIADALETSQGAARVRVHRALANVRGRLGVDGGADQEAAVVNRLGALAIIPFPASRLDSAIRGALEAANAAPVVPASQGFSSVVRAGMQAFGAVVLLAGAATTSTFDAGAPEFAGLDAAPGQLAIASGAESTAAARGAAATSRTSATSLGMPRPEDWDGGALARLARGDSEASVVEGTPARPAAPEQPAAQPTPAAPAPVVAPAARQEDEERPTSAFRPSARGASAANCDPGSSDGERADALGGFWRSSSEPAADRAVVVDRATSDPVVETPALTPAPRRRETAARRAAVPVAAPDGVLVDQAVALVRDVVTQTAPAPSADSEAAVADAKALRRARVQTVRALRKQYQVAQRAEPKARRLSSAAKAKMNRLLAMLVDFALADGKATADQLRWPEGVDPTTALQDVIRVLSAAPTVVTPPTDAPVDETPPADETAPNDGTDPVDAPAEESRTPDFQ
jgi:RNA polymerase sigma-70 factor (ECF subfamily)